MSFPNAKEMREITKESRATAISAQRNAVRAAIEAAATSGCPEEFCTFNNLFPEIIKELTLAGYGVRSHRMHSTAENTVYRISWGLDS